MIYRHFVISLMIVIFNIFLTVFAFCNKGVHKIDLKDAQIAYPSVTPVMQKATVKTPIRLVDFSNFSYPAYPVFSSARGNKDKIHLQQGIRKYENDETVGLVSVVYGDVTSDGKEDALVILVHGTRGTGRSYTVYIHTMIVSNPSLIWSIETGDRADYGLKKIYAEQGDLVVEKYSPDDNHGTCCPSYYVKDRYKWDNGKRKFLSVGKTEKIKIDDPDARATLEFK